MAWHGGRMGTDQDQPDIPLDVIKECRRDGLLVLGGSDYQDLDWKVGTGNGQMFISLRRREELKERLEVINNGKR